MRLQRSEEFIDHGQDNLLAQRLKRYHCIQTVSEFRGKQPVDGLHGIGTVVLNRESDGALRNTLRTGVRGHDNDDVTEIGFAAVVVSERAVIHHLQQKIKNFWVRLLNFIEQDHRVRVFGYCIGQQTALIIANIAWRRANQTRYGMPLHVFRHIKPKQFEPQLHRQLFRYLCFTYPRRPSKQEATNGLVT